MIQRLSDPVYSVIDVCEKLYPDVNCELVFAQGIKAKENAWAVTIWPDDGSTPQIWIDVCAPYEACCELVAHEFAHVVAGHNDGHGLEWDKVFTEINEEFNA